MAYQVRISDLGVENDYTVIEGQTPGDVWRQVVQRLKDKHNIDIPALDDIGGENAVFAAPRFDNAVVVGQQVPMAGTPGRTGQNDDAQSRLIVTRLIEKLHLGQPGSGSSDTVPPATGSPTA